MKKIVLSFIIFAAFSANAQIPFIPKPVQRHPFLTSGLVVGATYLASAHHTVAKLARAPQEAPRYLNENPDKVDAIIAEVLNRIRKSSTPEEYQTFVSLAQYIGIRNIPPYAPINPQASIPGKNYTQDNPRALINELPISVSDASNIIYTPQDQRIDTSTEYPYDKPRTYEDYLTLKQHSAILADNMRAANMGARMPGYAAHHIVPATSAGATDARRILAQHGIDFNDAVNGVYLPTASNNAATQGIVHNGKHPDSYVDKINQMIIDADARGGEMEVRKTLRDTHDLLKNAPMNGKWGNIL